MRARLREEADEEGAVLVIALAFLLLLALFVPALLGTTTTSLSVSQSVELQRQEVYAGEAGLRTRVETLRNSRTSAVYGSSCGPTSVGTFNGLPVRVQCAAQPSSGDSGLTRPPYAVLALPTVGSGTEGITDRPTVGGGGGTSDVYVGGDIASNGKVEHVANGAGSHFYVSGTAKGHSCLGGNIDDPATNSNVCSSVATVFTDPGVTDARYAVSGAFPSASNPAATCLANAARFVPGYYSAMPTSPCGSKPWWFVPGLYYFDFTSGSHVLNLTGRSVVAGTPNLSNFNPSAGSATPVSPGACKIDGDLPPFDGVEWVFGGDTVLDVGTGIVELCPTVSYTRQEISVRGYGAGGATGTAPVTQTYHPTTNDPNPNAAFGPGVGTGANAYAHDGALAVATVTSSKKNQTATSSIMLAGFANAPASAQISKVVIRLKHAESYTTAPTLAASVAYTTGATPATTWPPGCGAGRICPSSTQHVDTLDVTDDFLAAGGTLSALSVSFSLTTPGNTTSTENLDGVEVDVTYVPAGGFRTQAGCAVLASSNSSHCDTVSVPAGGSLYMQGTLYAPLGSVSVVTATGDPVQLNRGVIVRDVVGAIHPGNGSANPFGIGRPQRLALLTAEVLKDGTWTPRTESLVRFDDNIATATTRGRVTYLSWRAIR